MACFFCFCFFFCLCPFPFQVGKKVVFGLFQLQLTPFPRAPVILYKCKINQTDKKRREALTYNLQRLPTVLKSLERELEEDGRMSTYAKLRPLVLMMSNPSTVPTVEKTLWRSSLLTLCPKPPTCILVLVVAVGVAAISVSLSQFPYQVGYQ